MSLVRLLAAGKSVVGMSNDLSPYRLTHQRLLPNFGPGKAGPCLGVRVEEPGAGRTPTAPAADVAAAGRKRGREWLTVRLSGLLKRAEPKPEKPAVRPPIQGELRLDHVKVVRNDLSDSDRELVQLRPRLAVEEVGVGKQTSHRLAAVRGLFSRIGASRT